MESDGNGVLVLVACPTAGVVRFCEPIAGANKGGLAIDGLCPLLLSSGSLRNVEYRGSARSVCCE